MTRVRTIYVMRSAVKEADAKPSVFIEALKDGTVTYGVRASGSSLRVARVRAQEEFAWLSKYVDALKKGELPIQ